MNAVFETIDYRTVLFKPFLYLKKMLIVGIAVALLLSGYEFLVYNGTINKEENEFLYSQYITKRQLMQKEIESLNNDKELLEDYRDNSILIAMNNGNSYTGTINYLIYVENDDATNSKQKKYLNTLYLEITNNFVEPTLLKVLGSQNAVYLNELYDLRVDVNSGLLILSFSYYDKEIVEQFINILNEYVNSFYREDLNNAYTLKCASSVKNGLFIEKTNSFSSISNSISELDSNIKKLENELNNMKTPNVDILDVIKQFSIGFFLGAFIVYLINLMKIIFSRRIESVNQINNSNLCVVLGVKGKMYKDCNLIERKVYSLIGIPNYEEENYKKGLKYNCKIKNINQNNILYFGEDKSLELENVTIDFLSYDEVGSSKFLEKNELVGAYLLEIVLGKTKISEIEEIVKMAKFSEKEILGYIVIC